MTDPFAGERLQFFLRNREDIRTWAAIESEVVAATRELLAGAQVAIAERIAEVDPTAVTSRHDDRQWERILVRRPGWPAAVGLALEWNRSVDPTGANRPKVGVFWWADPPTLELPRARLVSLVDQPKLHMLGYKVPLGGVWPVGAMVQPTADWWKNAAGWLDGIVARLVGAWPLVAPNIDEALAGEPGVSGG